MDYGKILLASAIAASAFATTQRAAAWVPTWPLFNAVQIWHAGTSPSTSREQQAVCDGICDAAFPVDIFEDDRVSGKPSFWFVACIGKAGTGSLAGRKVIWNKRDERFGIGYALGVGPVAIPKAIGFMKPSTGADTNFDPALEVDAKSPVTKACGSIATATYRKSTRFTIPASSTEPDPTADTVIREPNIGTSDIEPDKFTSAFTFNVSVSDLDLDGVRGGAGDDLAPFNTSGLTVAGLNQLTYNTPVNLRMYLDLQAAQFPSGHPLNSDCHPTGAGYGNITAAVYDASGMPTSGGILDPRNNANSEKCMPNLQASEIRSIFAKGGAIRTSRDFQAETVYGGGAFAELDTVTTRGSTDNTIQICRHYNGSGIQAAANAMILGYPCDATFDGSIDTLLPEAESGLTTFVSENYSLFQVEKCLNDFNGGNNTSNKNSTLRKRWAIGVLGLDQNAPGRSSYTSAYRFIKIDGFAPSLVNVHAGDYFFVGRQTLQYKSAGARAETIDAFSAMVPWLTAPWINNTYPFYEPYGLIDLNKVQAFCTTQGAVLGTTKCAGWLAAPSTTFLPTSELSFSSPVGWFQRISKGGSANTCALPSAFKKTGGVDITVGPATGQGNDANTDGDQNFYTP